MSGTWRGSFYLPFSPLLYTLPFLDGFRSARFIFFFLFLHQNILSLPEVKVILSCPVRQTSRDLLAVEAVLNVAKDSFLYFSDVGEEKVCRMLLCRPQCGCLKRLFWAFLASLAKLVLLEVTFRVKLQYKLKKSNKNWSISKQPVGHAKITREVETTKEREKKIPRRAIIRIFAQV